MLAFLSAPPDASVLAFPSALPPIAIYSFAFLTQVPHYPCTLPSPPKRSLRSNNLDDEAKRALTDANQRRTTPLALKL